MNPYSLLNSFKKREVDIQTLPILADKNLLMAVWSWTKIRVKWEPPEELEDPPSDEWERWDLLWKFSSWDFEELVFLVGKSHTMTARLFERVRRFRLIYPDGTISDESSKCIVRYMAKLAKKDLAPIREEPEAPEGDDYDQ